MYIYIVTTEIAKSGDPLDVYWTLRIEHASRDCVDMIFIDIIRKHQTYSANNICLGGQPLICFQYDCGGSSLTSKKFAFVADNCGGRIIHYK